MSRPGGSKSKEYKIQSVISGLLAVTLCFCLCGTASADGDPAADAAERLRAGLTDSEESIDLTDCRLPRDRLSGVLTGVLLDNPELFHTDSRMSFTYDREGYVLAVFPTYTLSGAELIEARRLYRDTVDAFCRELAAARAEPSDGAWTEADTVLLAHEWLALRCAYDGSGTRFDAYSLFRDGLGVCQAYALAFLALMRAAGLDAEVVVSGEMDHAWNRVRADGEWFLVDVTRDDTGIPAGKPAGAPASGAVRHDRLFMTDETAAALGYAGYDVPDGRACVSARFAGADNLPGCVTALVRAGGCWYTDKDGLPTRVRLSDGAVGLPGDTNGDGSLSLRDLLLADSLWENSDRTDRLRLALLDRAGFEKKLK